MLDDGRLVVAHAGLKEAYHGRASGRVRSFALYGDSTGETDEYGLPVRYPWANDYRGKAMVLYGHTPIPEPEWVNNTLCLDTGCVFGGSLTALRYPEKEIVAVPAQQVWYEPVKPLPGGMTMPTRRRMSAERVTREELTIDDVLGRRVIDTAHHGRITIREDSAAGALEVMSRFALHPRWLPYLPPTMAPVATAADGDLLERPAEAFAAYRAAGVTSVICEEKHMGSRAVVLICRDPDVAGTRFGAPAGETGAVYTRTGRPFFAAELTERLLARLRAAVTAAGLWDELDTGWILLDCELLPWSAKAEDLLRDQYGSVGAAARAALPAAVDGLTAAAASGIDVAELLARTAVSTGERRGVHRCVPPLPMAGGRARRGADRAVPGAGHRPDHLLRSPARLASRHRRPAGGGRARPGPVDRTDHRADRFGGIGGRRHGLVARAHRGRRRGDGGQAAGQPHPRGRGLVQPGIKVRGREYLRIIYGPDYTEPANLERLRQRNLGHKQSLAAAGVRAGPRGARPVGPR